MADTITSHNFKQFFQTIIKDIVEDDQLLKDIPETLDRLKQVLEYNVLPKAEMSGFLLAKAYGELCGDSLTKEKIDMSFKLGWSFRILQAFLTMLDDYMDDDELRFGKPTWYSANGKKPIALNDTIILDKLAHRLLKKYFRDLPIYPELVEYFSNVALEYLLGQNMDHTMTSKNDEEMTGFTMKKYETCVRYTNLRYIFAGPLQLAMLLAGISEKDELWQQVETICEKLAYFWAVKDDLNDSFGEHLINEMTDNDIKLGKCTWLIIKAKQLSSKEQWNALKRAYGKDDSENVAVVKDILQEMKIPELCNNELNSLRKELVNVSGKLEGEYCGIGNVLRTIIELYGNMDE